MLKYFTVAGCSQSMCGPELEPQHGRNSQNVIEVVILKFFIREESEHINGLGATVLNSREFVCYILSNTCTATMNTVADVSKKYRLGPAFALKIVVLKKISTPSKSGLDRCTELDPPS